jgi:hypothetical protein
MNRKKIIASIAVLALITVGLVWYSQKLSQERARISQETVEETLRQSETPAPIDTTNWQVYRNEKYGFEFQYPPELAVVEEKDTVNCDETTCALLLVIFRDSATVYQNFLLKVFGEKSEGKRSKQDSHSEYNGLESRTNKVGTVLYGPTPFYDGEEIPASYRTTFAEHGSYSFVWWEMYNIPTNLTDQEKVAERYFGEIIDSFRFTTQ